MGFLSDARLRALPGFKFTRGSDSVFGIGMVIFANDNAAKATADAAGSIR
jgi:hypothetical protein